MQKKSVLIAAASISYGNTLQNAINAHSDFTVADLVADGRTALEAVTKYVPDILILDLMLPGRDGLSVLIELCTYTSPPAVIAISIFQSEYTKETAIKYGASYLLPYSATADEIISHMTSSDFTNRLKDPFLNNVTLHRDISHLLTALNIPKQHIGYKYLYNAVEICIFDCNAVHAANEQIFKPLGKRHFVSHLTASEKISQVLKEAFHDGAIALFAQHLHCYPLPGKDAPTPLQCIASIAEKIRVGY